MKLSKRISGTGWTHLRSLETTAERRKMTETVYLHGSETWQANSPWSRGFEGENVTASGARCGNKSHQF